MECFCTLGEHETRLIEASRQIQDTFSVYASGAGLYDQEETT